MKEFYIDLIEKVVGSYTDEHIDEYTKSVEDDTIAEHGFPRLTANIGILIAHGRKTYLKERFVHMMDLCCREMPTSLSKYRATGNDFSVKEIVFCLLELEKAKVFDVSLTERWRRELAVIDPYKTYLDIAEVPPKSIGNWASFNAASEQLRKYAGIGDESAFIDNQIASQILDFDENGMYRDPHEPMVYDMVTRLQLMLALHFGYDGVNRAELEENLIKSADITLYMQSVTGEIPFGGRSNQFLHNEGFLAALFECYATYFKDKGDMNRAGKFKRVARIATESVIPWLYEDEMHHIKNFYPVGSQYGCESYGYFNKYMVTAASWFYAAYIMADDDIPELPCPAETDNFVWESSVHFHKIFCKCADYYVEFDTCADPHYDGSGIGRIHKRGAPSAICLSVPFAEHPKYGIDIENPSQFAISVGSGDIFAVTTDDKYETLEKNVADDHVSVKLRCTLRNGVEILETCKITDDGVEITAEGDGEVQIAFPMLLTDGKHISAMTISDMYAEVSYRDHTCRYSTDNIIRESKAIYANRNGHYKSAVVSGCNKVALKVEIA